MTIEEGTFEKYIETTFGIPEVALPDYLNIVVIMAERSLGLRIPTHGDPGALVFGSSPYWGKKFSEVEEYGKNICRAMNKPQKEWETLKFPAMFGKGEHAHEVTEPYQLPFQDHNIQGILQDYINELDEYLRVEAAAQKLENVLKPFNET